MPASTIEFKGEVRMEWYQTLDGLSFSFFVKDRTADDVTVTVGERELDVSIALDGSGRIYEYSLGSLYAGLAAGAAPVVSVRPMKVEVVVKKETAYTWPALERAEDAVPPPPAGAAPVGAPAAAASALPAPQPELKYPNSKGKDWSTVKFDEEEEEKGALDSLFKQIYGGGTDEQRRAMVKSFTESGGTVLSTNWDDIGAKKTEVQPPKGMERKMMAD